MTLCPQLAEADISSKKLGRDLKVGFVEGSMECRWGRASVRLDVGRTDNLAPLVGFIGNEPSEVSGRASEQDHAQVSPTVGTSGKTSERMAVVTPSGRSLPALMCAIDEGRGSNITWTCPAKRSDNAGAEPR